MWAPCYPLLLEEEMWALQPMQGHGMEDIFLHLLCDGAGQKQGVAGRCGNSIREKQMLRQQIEIRHTPQKSCGLSKKHSGSCHACAGSC